MRNRDQGAGRVRFWLPGLLLVIAVALSACQARTQAPTATPPPPTATPAPPTPTPAPLAAAVAPVTGLPQGSDGLGWWNNTVFYEVFVRSFYDSNGDGIGDLNGLIARLDYLNDGDPATTNDLGITGLWLMPIMVSPSYHGYDITDYYQVNPDYGTNDDFKRLMVEAHKRGIRVLIDMVLNHTSNEHPWFLEAQQPSSAKENWYIWSTKRPPYLGPWGQNVWHKLGDRYYYGIFWEGMPDLNYRNPDVVAEMDKVSAFWLQEMGVDGFRLDAARYILEDEEKQASTPETHQWWKRYDAAVKAINPEALLVGEVWTATKEAAEYVKNGELDMNFEFDLAGAMVDAARNRFGASVGTIQNAVWKAYPSNQFAPFLTNHDQNRVMSVLGDDVAKARMAAALLLTAPGAPFLYYGEEIGMIGSKPDEQIRTPMQWTAGDNAGFSAAKPWIAVKPNYATSNVETEGAAADSLLAYYRTLIHLRSDHEALRVGDYTRLDPGNSRVYAFLRHSAQENILVLINLDDVAVSDYQLTLPPSALRGAPSPVDLLTKTPLPAPALKDDGSFNDYRPLSELAPQTAYLIKL
ncbi:alpha-amylase family glycosyl hydrolase [Candidatus Amarolinea aalborgensis]|uniref:alpha-amylase family glycosyl hydrolase n=1 Tax=Candidatus Amarolinea aalborgensis TaxID=2249329 RepID=UPI003BF9A01F